jgi:hypothetical protein
MQQILIAAVWILASQMVIKMVEMVEMKRNKNKNDR